LLIVGGQDVNGNPLSDVEVVDLSKDVFEPCLKPGDLPVGLFDAVGTYVNGQILVCGGSTYDVDLDRTIESACYRHMLFYCSDNFNIFMN